MRKQGPHSTAVRRRNIGIVLSHKVQLGALAGEQRQETSDLTEEVPDKMFDLCLRWTCDWEGDDPPIIAQGRKVEGLKVTQPEVENVRVEGENFSAFILQRKSSLWVVLDL